MKEIDIEDKHLVCTGNSEDWTYKMCDMAGDFSNER